MNSIFRLSLVTLVCLQWSALPLRADGEIQENWKPYVISVAEPFYSAVALRKGWGRQDRLHSHYQSEERSGRGSQSR
jgi:hypothetical protein